MKEGLFWEFCQGTGVTPLLLRRVPMGSLMTTESQDLGLTSHPKDGAHSQDRVPVSALGHWGDYSSDQIIHQTRLFIRPFGPEGKSTSYWPSNTTSSTGLPSKEYPRPGLLSFPRKASNVMQEPLVLTSYALCSSLSTAS